MIFKSSDKQFGISADGQIFFQPDPTNPLPGMAVAKIVKGESLLKPKAMSTLPEGTAEGLAEKFQEWLDKNIEAVLEPLFRLVRGEDLVGPAKDIAEKLQSSLGIIPRDDIQEFISKLDEEGRKILRLRKVRLGPILVFLPELNKPVAIKLRALLLSIWQDKPLPAACPNDGMVSFSVVDKVIDSDYYRQIGYPVFGPRAVRVDMLDRVVSAIYDTAKDGQFQALHKMAEWLGANIPDLYAVLEAMGHTKVEAPIEKKLADELMALMPAVPTPAAEEPAPVAEEVKEEVAETVTPTEISEETPATVDPAVAVVAATVFKAPRPELAYFKIKRGGGGRASHASKPRSPRAPKVLWERSKDARPEKPERKEFDKDKKKPFGDDKPKFKKKKFDDRDDKRDDRPERIYTAEAKKKEDSPFAILSQLKIGNDGKN